MTEECPDAETQTQELNANVTENDKVPKQQQQQLQNHGTSWTVNTEAAAAESDKSGKQNRKQTCIVKLDGCHYTIVANTTAEIKSEGQQGSPNSQQKHFPRSGSLTVLRRTMSGTGNEANRKKNQSAKTNSLTGFSQTDSVDEKPEDGISSETSSKKKNCSRDSLRNLSDLKVLPPADKPEALHACSVRLKELVKKVIKDEFNREELLIHLEYAARACENIYIVENSRIDDAVDDDDVLGVVEPDSVPREVRDWLTMTFTRTAVNSHRQRGEERVKFRSVANAIRAGIMVDRIYRRSASLVCHDAPPVVQQLLRHLDDWSFDVFAVSDAGDGHALYYVGYELLHRYDLPNKFKIGHQSLVNFLLKLENGYSRYANPYHNLLHAADVTQTTHAVFTQSGLAVWMTDLEIFATLFSALIHDYEHTGTTNTFHVNTSSEMAIVYNDRSVLENYHVSATFRLMKEEEFNILSGLKVEEFREFRSLVIELVLATDMSNHFQQIKTMRNLLTMPENLFKSQVLSLLVHCADISHPAKDWDLHHRWTERLLEEFFRQGDREAKLGLQISPLCDRKNTLVPESQIGFIDFIVDPTFTVLHESVEALNAYNQQQCLLSGGGVTRGGEGTPTGPSSSTPTIPHSSSQGDLGSPSTPKLHGLTGRSQKLKDCWTICLADNKLRWKERSAKESAMRQEPLQNEEKQECFDDDDNDHHHPQQQHHNHHHHHHQSQNEDPDETVFQEVENGGHGVSIAERRRVFEELINSNSICQDGTTCDPSSSGRRNDDKITSRSTLVRQDDVTSPTESAEEVTCSSLDRTPSQ